MPLSKGNIRTALDMGAGVASFAAELLPYKVVTLSYAPADQHVNQSTPKTASDNVSTVEDSRSSTTYQPYAEYSSPRPITPVYPQNIPHPGQSGAARSPWARARMWSIPAIAAGSPRAPPADLGAGRLAEHRCRAREGQFSSHNSVNQHVTVRINT
eukprot:5092307-Pyramimonas_sp.AAC.1